MEFIYEKSEVKIDEYVSQCYWLGLYGFRKPIPKDQAIEILKQAHEIGYDFYDTAQCYTGFYLESSISCNEEIVGEAIKDFRSKLS